MIIPVTFAECGFNPKDYPEDPRVLFQEAVQLACDFLMDVAFPEFNEADVIRDHRDITIDWTVGAILVPVAQVYKPEHLQ